MPTGLDYLSFKETLAAAVAEVARVGFVGPELIEAWVVRLRNAAEREAGSDQQIDADTRAKLGAIYQRFVNSPRLAQRVPGVTSFTKSMVSEAGRAELDRRVWANADLIKLNKRRAVEEVVQRFSGWTSSVPPGGSVDVDVRAVRASVGKSVAQLGYERRRCTIDQSHKLMAAVSAIVAKEANAIAGEWHDHGEHDARYNARKEHMARAGKIYLVRGSWADQKGLLVPVHGYMDEITQPAEEVYCRCWYRWVTSPRRLPKEYLSPKGQQWIEEGSLAVKKLMEAA